jgi:hypothetical protein
LSLEQRDGAVGFPNPLRDGEDVVAAIERLNEIRISLCRFDLSEERINVNKGATQGSTVFVAPGTIGPRMRSVGCLATTQLIEAHATECWRSRSISFHSDRIYMRAMKSGRIINVIRHLLTAPLVHP